MNRSVLRSSVSIVFLIAITLVLFCGVFNQSHASSSLTFTEIGAATGVTEPTDTNGSSVADFDGDGLEDLILVGYLPSLNRSSLKLFRNNGNGTFTDVTNS